MKYLYLIAFIFVLSAGVSQSQESQLIRPGTKAPSFILYLQGNTIQSYTMPYMRRIVLLHFWSSSIKKSRAANKYLDRLAQRYKNAHYRNAEGFEIVAVAVQTDKNAWQEAIEYDTLSHFTHGIALRGYNDDVCRKYGVTNLPTDVLIDDNGLVIAVNPSMSELEDLLDNYKNSLPVKKDITGRMAQSSDKSESAKFIQLYLFNFYGDSVAKTTTNQNGEFLFRDIKLNQDFILKVDNKIDITTSDPIALYTPRNEFMMDGRTKDQGFVFYIPARYSGKLTADAENSATNPLGQIDVIKRLNFFTNGKGLTPKDEQDLNSILSLLQKDKTSMVEIATHTDSRMDATYAMELTGNQANTIKDYLIRKGIAATRIKAVAKGNTEQRKICGGTIDCREEDHMINRRVEFLIYKN